MSNEDIAKAGGLARSTVAKVSRLDSWDSLTLRVIAAFSAGCGIDLLRLSSRRDKRLLSSGRLTFMKRGSSAQRRMFARLLNDLRGGRRETRGALDCNPGQSNATCEARASL
jgi:hypothetical protein